MGGFLKSAAQIAGTTGATAAGGPLAGAAIGTGTGMLGNVLGGNASLGSMLGQGVMQGGMGALGGYSAANAAKEAAAIKSVQDAQNVANENMLLSILQGKPVPGIRNYTGLKLNY